ncbi:glycoside hydrolase family 13 protein [Haloechinothrix sp. LS1_15]|uniref:glycoside hydrolase family 13 protein n=1 Tax=Haloechinothrix sp. LS1_15 TaxID=2652248 RepID=UPI0029484BE8|nr:glycoside hydrolase family 13 protein [Haloechinothrix sp. LS1_15]MDV6011990.1 glycoside hydrolase family 13 protein [Haloechinothrix sp. LS1_15]
MRRGVRSNRPGVVESGEQGSHYSGEEQEHHTWWRDAVVYVVYVRSFADSNGDGNGDLEGVRSRLGYLELLGVDALWLTPFYASPMADGGYDVADPRSVDPMFGDLEAFDALIADAHAHGIRVLLDLVPNHTSDQHEWFVQACAAGPGSAERDRYIFRPGSGPGGHQPPNNWLSAFGGPAWTRIDDGGGTMPSQWYLHLFAPEQPDLNWENAEVRADFERTMRFWLDRGVDGFRIDVAHGIAKPAELVDMDPRAAESSDASRFFDPRFDNDGVHEVHRRIRGVLDEYPGRMAVGEVWAFEEERFARYLAPGELHQAFDFRLALARFDAESIRTAVHQAMTVAARAGTLPTWTLTNHDLPRQVSRYGGGEVGLRRARAMALVELALPGAVYVYNGEELGLPDAEIPDEVVTDPMARTRPGHPGRDRARVPIPWEGEAPPYEFSGSETTWLPMPKDWDELTVAAQLEDPGSILSLYRSAIDLRRELLAGVDGELEWSTAPPGCLAFRRSCGLVCVLNASGAPVQLPAGEVLLSSADVAEGMLPADAAAWLR